MKNYVKTYLKGTGQELPQFGGPMTRGDYFLRVIIVAYIDKYHPGTSVIIDEQLVNDICNALTHLSPCGVTVHTPPKAEPTFPRGFFSNLWKNL